MYNAIQVEYERSFSLKQGRPTYWIVFSYSFGNAKQDSVYRMVAACEREEGIGRDELLSALKSKMSKTELDEALEFLSNEGHVYSTTDEDHFKTTDS